MWLSVGYSAKIVTVLKSESGVEIDKMREDLPNINRSYCSGLDDQVQSYSVVVVVCR